MIFLYIFDTFFFTMANIRKNHVIFGPDLPTLDILKHPAYRFPNPSDNIKIPICYPKAINFIWTRLPNNLNCNYATISLKYANSADERNKL